jgi:type IV pilus assembly protein PilY1
VASTPSTTSFTYVINTTPTSPASAITGSSITATRSTGFAASDLTNLINWVRGQDNMGDEKGPGGTVTLRPSVHGDVLHSRPTVLNYGSNAISILSTADSGTTRTATASTADVITISASSAVPVVTFANKQSCPVTVASGTTFTYSTSNCGAAGAQSANVGSKIVVFYGDNGGVFHAINGNQVTDFGSTGPGDELWGFVPKEFFTKLTRQRTNSPQLNLSSTPPGITPTPRSKDYFIDGATGVYQVIDGNGNTSRAILYLSMRRGGNFIYAIDVTTPASPTVLWKVDNTTTGMSELGQTWSQPKVARVLGYSNPVVIMGAGYSTNQDSEPISTADASGRGIYVLDAFSGAIVWKATYTSGASSCSGNTTQAACLVSGMNFSIPADITLMDRNSDGYIDRLYATDMAGNIWRVDLQPSAHSTPDYWQVNRLASLGCWGSPCATVNATTPRKFFYAPEVIPATSAHNYDSVIIGSGDREHPLYVSTSTQSYNQIFLIKDTYTGDSASGMSTIYADGLFDATSTTWDGTGNGYLITLAAGEKVVNAPLVVAGYAYMSTNVPASPTSNSCTNNLGTAKGYRLSPFTGAYSSVVFDGGGLPPSPVAGVVEVVVGSEVKKVPFVIGGANPDCVGADCSSALGGQKPPITVSTKRTRTYWYQDGK